MSFKTIVTKRSIVIATIAFLLALVSFVSVNVFATTGPVTGAANIITRPVRALASVVAHTFENIFASIYRYEELERRYDALAALYAQLVRDHHEAIELAEENARLRELLLFRERHGGYDHEMATVRGRGGDNWSHTFIIDLGYANSGVERGMGVATEYGFLIGQISDVSATTSTVRTILDTTFSAAAIVGGDFTEDGIGISATAQGDFNYMRSGLLVLDYIDDSINVLPGATVITSGHGRVFPPGLVIGEIERVFPHASGIGRFATIRPMREIDTLSTVFVITQFDIPE